MDLTLAAKLEVAQYGIVSDGAQQSLSALTSNFIVGLQTLAHIHRRGLHFPLVYGALNTANDDSSKRVINIRLKEDVPLGPEWLRALGSAPFQAQGPKKPLQNPSEISAIFICTRGSRPRTDALNNAA